MKNKKLFIVSTLSIFLLFQSAPIKAIDWVTVALSPLGFCATAVCINDLGKNSKKKTGVEFSLQSCGALALQI